MAVEEDVVEAVLLEAEAALEDGAEAEVHRDAAVAGAPEGLRQGAQTES